MSTLLRSLLHSLLIVLLALTVQTTMAGPGPILTPPNGPEPHIHGAKVFGVRPGAPFLFTVSATGDRPMTFEAQNLPTGLQLDPQTGRITGRLNEGGEHDVTLTAKNAIGTTERSFKIVCGSKIGLTPAMGWNSWNCFASAVSAEKIKAAADAMVASGLINHGYSYINIDDFWQVKRETKDPTLQGVQRDPQERIVPNPRFPDMKELTDYIHGNGLKAGIYSSPGPGRAADASAVGSMKNSTRNNTAIGALTI